MLSNMLYCPFCMFYMRQNIPSYFRLLHALPGAPAVDVYVNNSIFERNLKYKDFSKYFPVAPGVYNIKVFPANQSKNPIISTNLNIVPGSISTLAVSGYRSNPFMQAVSEPRRQVLPYRAYVRVVNLSHNAPAVDVSLPSGRRLFRDVKFRESEQYIDINPGKYTMQLLNTETGQPALTVPNISFKPGNSYSVYAVGLTGEQPPLQVLIPLDGSSYLELQ